MQLKKATHLFRPAELFITSCECLLGLIPSAQHTALTENTLHSLQLPIKKTFFFFNLIQFATENLPTPRERPLSTAATATHLDDTTVACPCLEMLNKNRHQRFFVRHTTQD